MEQNPEATASNQRGPKILPEQMIPFCSARGGYIPARMDTVPLTAPEDLVRRQKRYAQISSCFILISRSNDYSKDSDHYRKGRSI
jgi:hypothetical protein